MPAGLQARGLLINLKSKGQSVGLPPVVLPLPIVHGLTVAAWSGVYEEKATLNAYQRLALPTLTRGAFPEGISDNNDGSFTNTSGGTISVSGLIAADVYAASQAINILAGTDNSGADEPIIENSGAWYPYEGATSLPLCYPAAYSLELLPGKSVFPFYKSNSAPGLLYVGSLSHKIGVR